MKQFGIVFLAVLAGCASVIPDRRDAESLGQGELIDGCENVADNVKIGRLSREYYHTTWASAWTEGANAGLQEGLIGAGPAYDAVAKALANPLPDEGDPVFRDGMIKTRPFCRTYASDRRKISELVEGVVADIGNPIKMANIESGIFLTELADREHFAAKWKDDFIITVTEERTNRVVVKVLRNVYISRQGSAYHQGQSDGQLETWILMQIQNAFTPSYPG